ncbi:hypothetical protein GW916_11525 [bacterium]|nr:hypothetical protein [bacterium]
METKMNERRRMQVLFSNEAWSTVETFVEEANKDFKDGSIGISDVINEMIMSSKIDIKSLQAKRTDIKRSLKNLAVKDNLDLDSAIKALMDLKARVSKRNGRTTSSSQEEV